MEGGCHRFRMPTTKEMESGTRSRVFVGNLLSLLHDEFKFSFTIYLHLITTRIIY